MTVTTDVVASQTYVETNFFSRLGQFFESFRAAQVVAATYQRTRNVHGHERAIFDQAFDRI